MKYYVTADPHAHYTPLVEALTRKGFFDDTGEKRLVICGDLLDRGREGQALIDFLLGVKACGELILIRGNHEDLLEDALEEIAEVGAFDMASGCSHHATNGTWQTLLTLGGMTENDGIRYPHRLVSLVRQTDFYRELLPLCVDYYETQHHIFTHGWVPVFYEGYRPLLRYRRNPDWRKASPEEWRRARWLNGMDMVCRYNLTEEGKTVVCGHRSASYGHAAFGKAGCEHGAGADYSPFFSEGLAALDGCTVHSRIVNCLTVEDEPMGDGQAED